MATPEGKTKELLLQILRDYYPGAIARKVRWEGHNGAPDWLVANPRHSRPVFLELKAAGKAATFPVDAHERMQAREHGRMRAAGLLVFVVDDARSIHEALNHAI